MKIVLYNEEREMCVPPFAYFLSPFPKHWGMEWMWYDAHHSPLPINKYWNY